MQLLEEAKEEKFDERRVNLLKAQVMQLERQVSKLFLLMIMFAVSWQLK